MKHEHAKSLAVEVLNKLAAAIEQAHSEVLRRYLAIMGRFHRYSWGNALLLATQRPGATRVAGFHTSRKLGRAVRKGEKEIMMLAPMVVKKRIGWGRRADPPLRIPRRLCFRRSADGGDPVPEFARVQGDPQEYTDRLKQFIAASGIALEEDASIAPAQGVSSGSRIRLLPKLAPAEAFSVLVHELAHKKLHRGERRSQTSKTIREPEAETVAFVVCNSIGLDTNTAALARTRR